MKKKGKKEGDRFQSLHKNVSYLGNKSGTKLNGVLQSSNKFI